MNWFIEPNKERIEHLQTGLGLVQDELGTNKERIEHLETVLGLVQDEMQKMETAMTDKLFHLEETLNRISNVLLLDQETSNHDSYNLDINEGRRQVVSSKTKVKVPTVLRR